ncbi:glutathione peroxidase : Glutathione peroxidase OS=Sulfurospirillum barnesii (strain ATCC 700032 / DSM 10660 / SES-3) GN=Sulba_2121 PE=3 SV=1: GSHPx [Gemmata massiliana]|uniref:Glutathione peroxidase n=1 Tax=Gemmata massiliana TaxID=1210884 RepID=A0A6P2CXV5_9BACT|nr:glutathione peroxidase [Gemmata massiliana]VTR92624.1 glutathione peroxidase : Glutathione peroxidase OS=Sulfurospirillum barnesii (strain ATCC 700032 / DSM 10660 / SES-3) GN=Sulba_2121 PE=3 SV=1: GSHPx [Gemmata massiliana]
MSATATSLYDVPVTTIDNTPTTLEQHRGKVLLVVNVASKCGFTGQYKGLEELYRKYKDRGLVLLGFPCNQFMAQEPGNAEEIQSFCSLKYDVTFPMFAKVDVNGKNEHPLYSHLKDAARGTLGTRGIKWNFTKFLVDRAGNVVARYGPMTAPHQLTADIERLLG